MVTQCFNNLPSKFFLGVLPPRGLRLPREPRRSRRGHRIVHRYEEGGVSSWQRLPGGFSSHPTLLSGFSPGSAGHKLRCRCPGRGRTQRSPALSGWEREHTLGPVSGSSPLDPGAAQEAISTGGRRDRRQIKECLSICLRAELTQTQQKPNFTDSLFQSLAWSPAGMQPPALRCCPCPGQTTLRLYFFIYIVHSMFAWELLGVRASSSDTGALRHWAKRARL